MRGTSVCRLGVGLVVAVLASSCSDGAAPVEEATVTAAPTPSTEVIDVETEPVEPGPPVNTDEPIVPEPFGVTATTLQEALIAAVPYEGEPVATYSPDDLGDALVEGAIGVWVQVRLAADWHVRPNLTFCSRTEQRGFTDCRGIGTIPSDRSWSIGASMPPGDNVLEWWLVDDSAAGGLRRLLRHETNSGVGAYELAPGFETVNAVLGNPPPDGDDYLVPADPTTWEWPIELPRRPAPAVVAVDLDRVDGPVHVASAEVDTGSIVEWTPVRDRNAPAPIANGPFVVTLTGCEVADSARTVFHGVFEPALDTVLPLETRLSLGLIAGDVGTGGSVDVEFDRPGRFSVPLDMFHFVDEDEVVWHSRFDDRSGRSCELDPDRDGPGVGEGGWLDITTDLRPLPVVAPAGSVESLARLADTTSAEGPHVALTTLLHQHGDDIDGVDRLWVEPTAGPTSIRISSAGSCRVVQTTYADSWIDQRRGCRMRERLDGQSHMLGFFDGAWDVVVSGTSAEAATALLDGLAVMPFANVEPFATAESSFDFEADLDAFYEDRPEIAEFARVPWNDGAVSLWVTRDSRDRLEMNAIEAMVDGHGPGGGMSCFDLAVTDGVRHDREGWAVFATTDLTATHVTFTFKDEPYEADLDRRDVDPVSGDELVWAFVELPRERQNWSTLQLDAIHTPDGPVPCGQ